MIESGLSVIYYLQMKMILALAVPLALIGCSDVTVEQYQNWHDASDAGAIVRGWVPAFVPSTATNIQSTENIDTNAQTLEFTVKVSEIGSMVASLPRANGEDKSEATSVTKDLGLGPKTEVYIICAEPLNGALFADRETGKVVYRTPINWVANDCK